MNFEDHQGCGPSSGCALHSMTPCQSTLCVATGPNIRRGTFDRRRGGGVGRRDRGQCARNRVIFRFLGKEVQGEREWLGGARRQHRGGKGV